MHSRFSSHASVGRSGVHRPRRQPSRTGDSGRQRTTNIGQSVTPTELGTLTQGLDRFLAEVVPPDSLWAVFVRSVYAHARIRHLDIAEAAGLPGVVAILMGRDLGLPDLQASEDEGGGAFGIGRPILAREAVRFAGEAIALVIAADRATAEEAAAAVEVDAAPLDVVTDPRRAVEGRTILFPERGSNLVVDRHDSYGRPATACPESVTVEVVNQRIAAAPIEPIGMVAVPGERPRLTVWCGHQAPHRLRDQLAGLLGLSEDEIRVRVPRVGGAFGLKGILHPEYAAVAGAALRLGRPVAWLSQRREELLGGTHGRDQIGRITLAGDASGRILRADVEILANVGAYPVHGGELSGSTRLMATGPYDIGHINVRTRVVVTNTAPIGPYRGAGRPEAAYLLERGIDAFARRLDLDPAVVRRRNFIPEAAQPFQTPTGAKYDGGNYRAALDEALRLADAKGVRREQRERREQGADPIGLGIGVYVDRAGGGVTEGEHARVEVRSDGEVVVRTGSQASGQGHATVWSQVVADALTVPMERIRVIAGDTAEVLRGAGTFGSRSVQLGAAAAALAAGKVVDRARELAAARLEARAGDLELVDGAFGVAGVPKVRVPLADLAADLEARGGSLAAEEDFLPRVLSFPYGVFVAVVGVDPSTGAVKVRRIAAVNDCGRRINPRLTEDQVVGAILQGLGQAMLEEVVYDEAGQLLTSTFMDYLLPTAVELPEIRLGWLETPTPSNPLGAKGIGESGCIGVPQAIVNGALDALAPWGVADLQMPLLPDRVWSAIHRRLAGS